MINKSIGVEGMTLILSLFWGMVLAFEYDCIRVFRRIVKHKRVWTISVEDIIYELNNGIIRGFVTGGFIAGAFIYRYSVGKLFVKYTTFILQLVLKPLKTLIRFIIIKVKYFSTKLKSHRSVKKKEDIL